MKLDRKDFEIAAGSIVGRDHREVPKNSHDGFHVVRDEVCTVGIVTDGCGSGAHSEIGAKVGARLLSESIRAEINRRPGDDVNWPRIRQDALSSLHVLARSMGGNFREVVSDYFLFTAVGVYLAGEHATFFAIGDGVVLINDEVFPLLPEEGNKPAYLGYGLLPGQFDVDESETHFKVVANLSLDGLKHFLLGTDGVLDLMRVSGENQPGTNKLVGGIEQFWEQDRYYTNPELVSRQLKLVARDWPKKEPQPGLLPDDTTLIVGRRMPTET